MPTATRRLVSALPLFLLVAVTVAACSANGSSEGAPTTTSRDNRPSTTTTTQDRSTTTVEDPGSSTTLAQVTTTTTAATTSSSTSTTSTTSTTTTTRPVTTTTRPVTTTTGRGQVPATEQAYLDALEKAFSAEEGVPIDQAQSQCLAAGVVHIIGIDRLTAAGITPEELAKGNGSSFPPELGIDEAKANQMYDQFGACGIDLVAVFRTLIATGIDSLTAEQDACLDRLITDDVLRRSFLADALDQDGPVDPLDGIEECLGPNPGE